MGISKFLTRFFHSHDKVVRSLEGNLKKKQSTYPSYVYVLGSGYKYNPKVVFVSASSSRFLFNCGTGASRLLNEHKGKFRKLSAIFATRSVWENIGGLLSVSLKINDSKSKNCAMYGFPDLKNLLLASRGFLHLHHSKIVPSEGDYMDRNTSISAVLLKPDPHLNAQTGNFSKNHETVTAYVMKTNAPKRKNINVEKMMDEGISPGLQLVNLLKGESITLPNGKVIHPDDVTAPIKRNLIVVIECPTKDYLTSVVNSEKLKQSYMDSNECNTTVIHFSPSNVIKCKRYIEWMKKFSSSTNHLIVNESNVADGLVTLRYRQFFFSKLHPGIFPPLKENGFYWFHAKHHITKPQDHLMHNKSTPFIESDNPAVQEKQTADSSKPSPGSQHWLPAWKELKGLNIFEGRSGTRIPFRPFTVERIAETLFDEFVYREGFKSTLDPDVVASLRQKFLDIGVDITNPSKIQADFENSYPRVIFLGTGSKTDSRSRNVSGMLLRISKDSSIMLDCGEDSHSQLYRLYGDEAPDVFRTINAVYISHHHADHHLGLMDIIKERNKAFDNERPSPLILFATSALDPWFDFTKKFLPHKEQFIHVPLHSLLHDATEPNKSTAPVNYGDYLYSKTGLVKIQTARVPHCKESYGVALQHADGWKITYSGDTMLTDRLNEIGEGSDLLIHEATYDDTNVSLAIRNRHSTISQALETSRRMKAKFTILTHISQRYLTLPTEEMSTRKDFSFALDFMQVPLQYCHHLPILHEVYDCLNDAYLNDEVPENFDEEDEGAGEMRA